ncbi:MAG: HD domain-containing protein [Candidatus Omnitrophica bacterium]|nr:HD domain-containing protein [Candidatus Omnitrophota bacterium]
MEDKIEVSFKELISTLQIAKLYPDWHPQFKKAIDKAYLSLKDALSEREELVIGIIGEELAFEKEIFFGLSKMTKPTILYLKGRGIERIVFSRGLEKEELNKFIAFLVTPKEEMGHQPQEALSLLGIKNIVVGKIKASPSAPLEDKVKKSIDYLSIYEDCLDKVTDSLSTVLDENKIDSLALRFTVSNMMENLLGRHQDFLTLGTIKRYDARTFSHVLNVSILSMYFSSKVGFAKEEVLEIGTAALFHDIGKIYISRKIIQKPQGLTEEEFGIMKSHVVVGAQILLKHVGALGVLPAVVSFEHHLRYNLSGYPKLSFPRQPHIASLIVTICDVYDALSQRRGYKGDYPPEMIYDLMMREKGTTFEPQLLDKFFKIMGVWPVGTIVSLSDARIAVVREENEDDISSPKVEVIAGKDKQEMIDLRAVKEKVKIERSLNILKEGKEYLSLI